MTVNIDKDVVKVCRCFNIKGEAVSQSVFTDGHINTTLLVVFSDNGEDKKYLIQGINTHVFKNPEELMENTENVTAFLREKISAAGGDPDRETLTIVPTIDGKTFYTTEDGKVFRVCKFVERCRFRN